MKRIFTIILISISLQFSYAQPFKVVGYLPDYRWSFLNQIDYSKLTHVFAAFGNPDSSGILSFSQNIDNFATVVHSGGAKALLSLGGGGEYSWGNEHHTYEYLFTPANRTPFVRKIMDYVRLHNLDGIDLDLEGDALMLANYNVFAQELADSLHLIGKEIGAAYATGYWAGFVSTTTLQKIDIITTMSYGGVGSWNWNSPSDQAPFSLFKDDIEFWKAKGLRKDQVVGGLPFYAVEFPQTAQATYWQYHPTLCSIYIGPPFTSQKPLENDMVIAQNGNKIYFNSLKTFKKKIDYAGVNAGGIMIWELGSDCYGVSLNVLDTISTFVTIALSNKAELINSTFKLYPNPANTVLQFENPNAFINSYSITDVYGRQQANAELKGKTIDVSNLSPGMYFMNFVEQGNQHNPIPFMIQR